MSKRRLERRMELINEALPAALPEVAAARSALVWKIGLTTSLGLAEGVAGPAEGHEEEALPGKVVVACPSGEEGTYQAGGQAASLAVVESAASFHSTSPKAGLRAVAAGSTGRPS